MRPPAYSGPAAAALRGGRIPVAILLEDCAVNESLLGFLSPGPAELVLILVVALLLFGHRVPGLMRNLSRGIFGFRQELQQAGQRRPESNA